MSETSPSTENESAVDGPATSRSSREEHVLAIIEEIRSSTGDGPLRELLADFARAFHFRTPTTYFELGTPGGLARELQSALEFMAGRQRDEIRVRVTRMQGENCSLLQVNMNDQPFILDSVQELLRVSPVRVLSYLHPILQVDRGSDRGVLAVRPRNAPGQHESFLHFRLRAIRREEDARKLEEEALRSLEDALRAVDDFFRMKQRVDEISRELLMYPSRDIIERRDMEEAVDLLRWLLNDNFVFLGCRSYRFFERDGERHIQVLSGSGLGILRDESNSAFVEPVPFSRLDESTRHRLELRLFPLVNKGDRISRVHRRVPMDYVEIKQLDSDGELVGEHRIVGMFTAQAHNQVCSEIPVLKRKLKTILESAEVIGDTHDYKRILATFNSMPKAELFGTSVERIGDSIDDILSFREEKRVRVSSRPDVTGEGMSVMVLIPRDRFNSEARRQIQDAISGHLKAPVADYRLALSDEPLARLHFYFRASPEILSHNESAQLEATIASFLRTWHDLFHQELERDHDRSRAREIARRYRDALPESYRAIVTPVEAAADVSLFEEVRTSGRVGLAIHEADQSDGSGTTTIRLMRPGEKFFLSDIMPILSDLGLIVIDEATFRLENHDVPRSHLHTFRVRRRSPEPIDRILYGPLKEAILEIIAGRFESDQLGRLVIEARLSIRQVELLRAIIRYSRQIGAPHSLHSFALALSNHPVLTRSLVELFELKFRPKQPGPGRGGSPSEAMKEIQERILAGLEEVQDLDEDRVIRGLNGVINATVRTNYFQREGRQPRLAFKIESRRIAGMPRPVPRYEIFIHDAEMEGVHLRSGLVARGGIRWSERRDDYRTEILGLMRTQVTKNSIIVPVGSKGGFILKKLPQTREEVVAEVEKQYRSYISGLLDLTDNRVGEEIVHPDDTVIYDQDDPYLVVAADRGTATLSDVGNEIAREHGFWLNDAFASGGSHGYDHKQLGITARGVWECVRHAFLELGLHVDRDPFTVVGIGDMSGDVFGNGMLYSRQIRLVAAFDHRHIFIDPDPDHAATYEERKRLFELPRSSWQDFDPKVISEGGGVFPRQAKKIRLTPQMQKLLDGAPQETMSGEELIRTVLKLEVDLLYNGGIGTYVKASHETNDDAHDEKNDSVRVNANQLRCRVVGEGGNLGFTQAARVEFATHGGHINTDFIDNSGGVDLSDHEVNIKIALGLLLRDGKLSYEERNRLLTDIGPRVVEQVLRTNRDQALILSLEEIVSGRDVSDHLALLSDLQKADLIDPTLDQFPEPAELAQRVEASRGFLRPELATLLGFTKIEISDSILDTAVPDAPGFEQYLHEYFPEQIGSCCREVMEAHPLRRDIIATALTNEMVFRSGITLIGRLRRDLGSSIADVARTYRTADLLLDGRAFFETVMDHVATAELKTEGAYRLILEYREALADIASWLVRSWPIDEDRKPLTVPGVVERFSSWFSKAVDWLEVHAPEEARERFALFRLELLGAGVPETLADRMVRIQLQKEIPPVLQIAERIKSSPETVAEVYFMVRNALKLAQVLTALDELPVTGPDDRSAARALREEFRTLSVRLTERVLTSAPENAGTDRAVGHYIYSHWQKMEAYLEIIGANTAKNAWTLSSIIILSERLRRLVDVDVPNGASHGG